MALLKASLHARCRQSHGSRAGEHPCLLADGRDRWRDSSASLDTERTCVLDGCARRTMRIAHTHIRNGPTT
jgi:hypothetical protein